MLKSLTTIAIVLVLSLGSSLMAQEKNCPADRAAAQGFTPFETFHHIMAPVWHNSWPEKDYDALIAAGPKFKEAFAGIAAITLKLKNKIRMATLVKNRALFGDMVDKFAAAAKSYDSATVYDLMPGLHDAFEMTATAMLPLSFPFFEGLVITANLISETHLPSGNKDGIIGSTETLTRKINSFDEENIPQELISEKKEVLELFTAMKTTITNMQNCCDNDDMENYRKHSSELQKQLTDFSVRFI